MAISVEDNYSSGNFMQMQEQAIKRAREMQDRAKQNESVKNKKEKSTDHGTTKPPKPPIIQAAAPKEKLKVDNFPQISPQKALNSLTELFQLDSDRALILPLLLFLGKEGADDMLLLALLYIMS